MDRSLLLGSIQLEDPKPSGCTIIILANLSYFTNLIDFPEIKLYNVVVEPTHLKHMIVKMGIISPKFRGENFKKSNHHLERDFPFLNFRTPRSCEVAK